VKLLADESVEQQIVDRLRQDGHTVLYVAEMEPSIGDEVVLQRANPHQALQVARFSKEKLRRRRSGARRRERAGVRRSSALGRSEPSARSER
jgi:hypothetical protein